MKSISFVLRHALRVLAIGLATSPAVAAVAAPEHQVRSTAQAHPSVISKTTVVGRVRLADGTPVPNAVVVTSIGGKGVSRLDGSFALELVANDSSIPLRVTAIASIGGVNHSGMVVASSMNGGKAIDVNAITMSASAGCEPDWLPTFGGAPGMNNEVRAFATFDDGSGDGPALYVSGWFSTAGGVSAFEVAKWNGTSWSALGIGMNSFVNTLAVFDDGPGGGPALYAGGGFTLAGGVEANHVAKWNGTSWSALGAGVDSEVRALAVFDNGLGGGPALYVAGAFFNAGNQPANNIARWNGTSWTPLGVGMNNAVNALMTFDNGLGGGPALYAVGHFTMAGGVPANRIAKLQGASWSPLASGFNNNAHALTSFDDGLGGGPALYAGGEFTTAGGTPANRVAKWNGTSWSALGSGVSGSVFALKGVAAGASDSPGLYVGGEFTSSGTANAARIAKWNGTSWSQVSSGMSNSVLALTTFDDGSSGGASLFAGGRFTLAGDGEARYIAKWKSGTWSPVERGLNGTVYAITSFDDGSGSGPALYAAGAFSTSGSPSTQYIAKWNGTSWSALGSGVSDWVYALTTFDDGSSGGRALYAAGEFQTAGGVAVKRIAKWNGTSWSALGSGVNGAVFALTAIDDGAPGGPALYAGGGFLTAGGAPANRVAKWNGESWSALGNGFSNSVMALTMFADGSGSGASLYAGGTFETPGAGPGSYIAKWNGVAWTALPSGLNNGVLALTTYDDGSDEGLALYAGGYFTMAGGAPANRVAKWNGASWSPLGSGANLSVRAFATFDDGLNDGISDGPSLYVGGSFTSAGGVSANHIAKWDGASWSALSSGVDNVVFALAPFDDGAGSPPSLFAGGEFIVSPAGDSYIAQWQRCPLAVASDLNDDGAVNAIDLGILLGGWGSPGITDLNGDGTTDASDLAILLGAWTG